MAFLTGEKPYFMTVVSNERKLLRHEFLNKTLESILDFPFCREADVLNILLSSQREKVQYLSFIALNLEKVPGILVH